MTREKYRDTLTLTYKMLTENGKTQSKSAVINNLSDSVTDEDLFEIAQVVKDLLANATDAIHRKTDHLLLDD